MKVQISRCKIGKKYIARVRVYSRFTNESFWVYKAYRTKPSSSRVVQDWQNPNTKSWNLFSPSLEDLLTNRFHFKSIFLDCQFLQWWPSEISIWFAFWDARLYVKAQRSS
jgi:hypothetical protein